MAKNEETVSTSEMIELSGSALDVVAGGVKPVGDDAPDAPDAPGQAKKVK